MEQDSSAKIDNKKEIGTGDESLKRRKIEIDEKIRPFVEQHDYNEDFFNEEDLKLVITEEIAERRRVEFTLQQAAHALYKHRTCKSDVTPQEWEKLIGGRKLSTSNSTKNTQ